ARRADPDGVAGLGPPQRDARPSRGRSGNGTRAHPRTFPGSACVRIVIVGHGRMGRLVETLAPEHGCEVAGIAEVDAPLAGVLDRAGSVDVAIDFSQPGAVLGNLEVL